MIALSTGLSNMNQKFIVCHLHLAAVHYNRETCYTFTQQYCRILCLHYCEIHEWGPKVQFFWFYTCNSKLNILFRQIFHTVCTLWNVYHPNGYTVFTF